MNFQKIHIVLWFVVVAIIGALVLNWEYTLWFASTVAAFYVGYKYGRRTEKWGNNQNSGKIGKNVMRNILNNFRNN